MRDADLDTLLIAVYCAACSLFPAPREPKRRRGRPRLITDNELICLMVAQMLLGIPSERRFLPIAGWRLLHLFPHLPSQTTYNDRCRTLSGKLVTLWRAVAYELPGFHDSLLLLDTTPLPCGQSTSTVNRSQLAPSCGFGYSPDGALSNPFLGDKSLLVRLSELNRLLLQSALATPRKPRDAPPKASPVLETVILVLMLAGRPMLASEIYAAANAFLGRQLRWSSVKGILSAYALGGDRRFIRLGRGVYQLTNRPVESGSATGLCSGGRRSD